MRTNLNKFQKLNKWQKIRYIELRDDARALKNLAQLEYIGGVDNLRYFPIFVSASLLWPFPPAPSSTTVAIIGKVIRLWSFEFCFCCEEDRWLLTFAWTFFLLHFRRLSLNVFAVLESTWMPKERMRFRKYSSKRDVWLNFCTKDWRSGSKLLM